MHRFRTTLALTILLSCGIGAPAVAQPANHSSIVQLDPALDSVVAADAQLEELYTEAAVSFEGPTWIGKGRSAYLIFSVGPGDTLKRLTRDGKVSDFIGGIVGGGASTTGANGTTLDLQGKVIYAGFAAGQIVRLDTNGARTVLADRYNGQRLNTPNDLVSRSDGSLYFTDSISKGLSDGSVPHTGLYRVNDGKLQLLISTGVGRVNGLAFSPDEKYLYVGDTPGKHVLRYDVQRDGTLSNGILFIDMGGTNEGPDGIKVDKKGNVYSTGEGGVWIVSSQGKRLGTILTPRRATNLTFGGDDARTLYVTGVAFLARIPLKVAGIRPNPTAGRK